MQPVSGEGAAPDFDKFVATACELKDADCVLHISYEIDDVIKTSRDFYFQLQPLSEDPVKRLRQMRAAICKGGSVESGDGISKKTGKGIGFNGASQVINLQPDGIAVQFGYSWTTDNGRGALNYIVIFPYDRAFSTNIKNLHTQGNFNWVPKKSEQTGTDQPPAKRADKAPEKDHPFAPAPKDVPR